MTFTTSHLPRYLRSALSADPARPRLTYYDDATGERVELSAQTLANWVTKTMNLLIDEMGVEPGARVSLHLPAHWLTAVWAISADAVGARVHTPAEPAIPVGDLAGTVPNVVDVDTGSLHEVFAVSLAPMAMPLGPALPAGTRDYCAEVLALPDQLIAAPERAGTLADSAEARAADLGLGPRERVATAWSHDVASLAGVVDGLLAPLSVDGSAIWTQNPDAASCLARWTSERVTAVDGVVPAGVSIPAGIRHLGLGTG